MRCEQKELFTIDCRTTMEVHQIFWYVVDVRIKTEKGENDDVDGYYGSYNTQW